MSKNTPAEYKYLRKVQIPAVGWKMCFFQLNGTFSASHPQSTPQSRNIRNVSALSAGAYTATCYVMEDVMKGSGHAPSHARLGWFFHHDGMYPRNSVTIASLVYTMSMVHHVLEFHAHFTSPRGHCEQFLLAFLHNLRNDAHTMLYYWVGSGYSRVLTWLAMQLAAELASEACPRPILSQAAQSKPCPSRISLSHLLHPSWAIRR